MINPQFPGGKATMFICGNDDKAKAIVRGINDQFGTKCEVQPAIAHGKTPAAFLVSFAVISAKSEQNSSR